MLKAEFLARLYSLAARSVLRDSVTRVTPYRGGVTLSHGHGSM
jgi:hypothetical protein